jgi:hypothetical protein
MNEIEGGGPAFPIPGAVSHYDEGSFSDSAHAGMTLRDYFAAKALIALASSEVWLKGMDKAAAQAGIEFKDSLALSSYRMADAMLRARSQS